MNPRRTEALSDGTFAVAMTLLIFDVRLGTGHAQVHGASHDLWFGEWPHYVGYLVSFVVVGMLWLNHHSVFRLVRRIDHTAMVLNLLLLLLVVFIPFPTQVLAAYLVDSSSVGDVVAVFYGLALAAATLALALLWHHFERCPQLLKPGVDPQQIHILTRRLYLSPVLYLGMAAIAASNHWVGLILYLTVACVYILHTGTRAFPILSDEEEGSPAD